ncbi:Plug domain-containing protein [Niabella ginsengisoli]|uniref:Plug domain-containing protein n=1 Tax=Niabella ginsengisoli TaxID=522298 RepID=A0ABS9SQB2_9BACT|nr:Plug domain-containing protein [Niabella ginsengisoli]MCH5600565.1 Plug domain-containing protein [Niabella ginsengisoli]
MRIVIKTSLLTIIALITIVTAYAQKDTVRTLEEVQVTTGQYKPQSLNKSVYKVQVITAEKIRLKGATNLTQLLNTELGMGLSNDNTLGTTDISFMGVSGRNVKNFARWITYVR